MSAKKCYGCHDEPAGEGGILGANCAATISEQTVEDWYSPAVMDRARKLSAGQPRAGEA